MWGWHPLIDVTVVLVAAGLCSTWLIWMVGRDRKRRQETAMSDATDAGRRRVGVDAHARSCVDDDGKVECVCGLDVEPPLEVE